MLMWAGYRIARRLFHSSMKARLHPTTHPTSSPSGSPAILFHDPQQVTHDPSRRAREVRKPVAISPAQPITGPHLVHGLQWGTAGAVAATRRFGCGTLPPLLPGMVRRKYHLSLLPGVMNPRRCVSAAPGDVQYRILVRGWMPIRALRSSFTDG